MTTRDQVAKSDMDHLNHAHAATVTVFLLPSRAASFVFFDSYYICPCGNMIDSDSPCCADISDEEYDSIYRRYEREYQVWEAR